MKYKISDFFIQLICIFLLIIATSFLMLSLINYNTVSEKIINFNDEVTDNLYLRISDVYDHDNQQSLSSFFSEETSIERMQKFNRLMNDEYEFLEFDTQAILMKEEFAYKEEFKQDYGTVNYGANDHIGVILKSCQINSDTYEHLKLENNLMLGEGFVTESYEYDGQETIDAILGYEYSEIINVGDILKVDFLSKDISLKVVGFFEKDTLITINNNINFLDRYITIPFIDINTKYNASNEDINERRFQNILYSLKNWGYIKVSPGDDYFDYRDFVDKTSSDLDLSYVLNPSYVSPYIDNISNTVNSTKGIFLIFSIIVCTLLSIIYTYIFLWYYKKHRYEYAIHLISGCSLKKLKLKIFFRILIQFIVAITFATIINSLVQSDKLMYIYDKLIFEKSIIQVRTISLFIMSLIFVVINIYVNKSNMYTSVCKEL